VAVGLFPLMLVQSLAAAGNLLLAMGAMHAGMVALPLLVILASEAAVRDWYRTSGLATVTSFTGAQLLRGAAAGVVSAAVFAVGFHFIECRWGAPLSGVPGFDLICVHGLTRELIDSGFRGVAGMDTASLPVMLAFCAYFCTVNPFLEELFWRVFLHKEVEEPAGSESAKLVAPCELPAVPELWRWVISLLFASYHFAVIYAIAVPVTAAPMGFPLQAAAAVAGLVVFGRACVHMRETPEWGLWAAMLWHVGVDAGVCVVLLWPLWTDHARETSTPPWMAPAVQL